MAHALWSGSISFGLLNIPVQLMPGERRTELRFHLMDTRNKARVRYERINCGDRRRGPLEGHRQGLRVQEGQLRRAGERGSQGGRAGEQRVG